MNEHSRNQHRKRMPRTPPNTAGGAAPPRVLHTVFDDSLDAHWSLELGNVTADAASDSSLFCGQHLRLPIRGRIGSKQQGTALMVARSRSPIRGMDEPGIGLYVSFVAKVVNHEEMRLALNSISACPANDKNEWIEGSAEFGVAASCTAALCVSVKSNPSAEPMFASACRDTEAPDRLGWQHFRVPLRSFGSSGARPQLLILASERKSMLSDGSALLLDDLQFMSVRAPSRVSAAFFEGPPPPGALHAVTAATRSPDAASGGGGLGGGWCHYMSSDYRPGPGATSSATVRTRRSVPRCKMNGDHLRGRWLQNCNPALSMSLLRRRPDVYAYGRAMPAIAGKFDFRVCYRTSFWERERALQALSWTWRPYDCQMDPIDPDVFDSWLGSRTIVIVGDSLSAQLYYSLVFLLGRAIVDAIEHVDGMRRAPTAPATPRHGVCASGVADEGPSSFSEVRLPRGGRIVKVLGHTRYIQELQRVERAPWLRFAQAADFFVLSIGHHYRSVDRTFGSFGQMVSRVEASLRNVLKPSAHVVVRSTNVGHRGCENATRPLQDRRAAWERLAERPNGAFEWSPPSAEVVEQLEAGRGNPNSAVSTRRDPFDWRAPPLHEGAWARVFGASPAFRSRFSLLNVSFLDARVDGHVANAMRYSDESERKARWGGGLDCLHYCFPGPADFWSLSLYNLLMRLR